MKKVIHMAKLHKKKIILGAILIALLIVVINSKTIINRISNIFQKEELVEFEYTTFKVSGNIGTAQIIFRNENGIDKVLYPEKEGDTQFEVYAKGKTQLAIDYKMEDLKSYEFTLIDEKQNEKIYTIDYEIPRIKGNYTLTGGVYVNEPDLTGFVQGKTRYMYMNDEGNLVPGNWITDEAPTNWYNYNEQKWANIYVENNGIESYYVWIPRYAYKIDEENSISGNERTDVKFVNTYNEYIDGVTGEKTTWDELESQGYKLPEAFSWEDKNNSDLIIPGYWMSKYQLSELASYVIDYNMVASKASIDVKNFTTNTSKTIAKYTYAINGQIVYESTTLEDYSFVNTTPDINNIVNVTALDENGEIVGSMTKELELTEANPPDLTGFDKDTTFYVYWDENGIEHNEIPISQDPPEDWYNYSYSSWANIVTRNNGLESYFVWIPRYQYALDQTTQRSNVRFIIGTGTDTEIGYQIPEAFTWGDNGETQLTGYWMSKYQLSIEESTARVTAEMASGGTTINIRDITGTIITNAETNSINIKYEYYLNGTKVHEGNSNTENYVYTGLNLNTTYIINIILRNADTDEYLGAITKKVTTQIANEPNLTGFDKENTYYVLYDNEGNETQRISIKENVPDNWYDYGNRKWANIVTTANETESYFVWIPRYEYLIIPDRANASTANARTEVNFLPGTSTQTSTGYKIPEAFTWGDNGETHITGYWMSKYQLSN